MRAIAEGIRRLDQWPRPMVNVYLADAILIDAGSKADRRRIFRQIEGVELSLLALTHVHPDHQGVAKDVCESRRIPLACHRDDVAAMEARRPISAPATGPIARLAAKLAGPPHRVGAPFDDGDAVGPFRAVHTPGHSLGHTVFFRESDRVAVCGDVIRNMSYLTGRTVLLEPPAALTYDPAENRRSIRLLAALEPSLLLPGHGPPVTDMRAFQRFAAALPAD